MSETQEHLEHAEHAGHIADPFAVRMAMTMAIIAAILAAVSLIGHRKHNEALQKQGDSNRLLTEAAARQVESSNAFAWYQSKRARVEDAEKSITFAKLVAPAPNSDAFREQEIKKWEAYIKKNKTRPEEIAIAESGFPAKGDDSSGALQIRGDRFDQLAEKKTEEAKKVDHEFHRVHHQSDELDWAHLAVELSLVLCTICILTKKKEYWVAGIVAALAGAGLASYSIFIAN